MAHTVSRGIRALSRGVLRLFGAVGIVGLSLPASAAWSPQRTELEARVAAARQQMRAGAGPSEAPIARDALLAQARQWNNWPNWSNWSNWANG
jgi:hypothetical protein